MKRENIEKAATSYANDVCKGSHHRCGMKQYCMVDFIEGAEWRINSVWHDANEQPDRGKDIIVMYSNKSCRVFLPNGIWDNLIKVDKFIKWAYIDDLLPNMEE